MSNLLDQWNEHIVRGNQLSRELEDIEDILEKSKGSDICFSSGTNGAVFIRVLSPEKMQELRENVVVAIMRTRDNKAAELEKLMGVRKPATINPEFEAAVQGGMIESSEKLKPVVIEPVDIPKEEAKKIEGEPVPLKPSEILEAHAEEVLKMYSQMATYQAIATKYGVSKNDVNNFFTKHKTVRRASKKDDGFLDAKVETMKKQPAETECP